MFGLNDFDETLPGPFEYDVKRMAASFTIAARNNGFTRSDAHAATLESVASYRAQMAEFAGMGTLDIWYAHLSEQDLLSGAKNAARAATRAGSKNAATTATKTVKNQARKAHTRDSLQALSKLAEQVDGRYQIVSQPPVVIPLRDLAPGSVGPSTRCETWCTNSSGPTARRCRTIADNCSRSSKSSTWHTRSSASAASGCEHSSSCCRAEIKATRCSCRPRRRRHRSSKTTCRRSRYRHPGERVVQGQRLMQATSDIFLGWTKGHEENRYLYWRQLRDMKSSALVETMIPAALTYYAQVCGRTLARAHARSGDPVALAAYMGKKDRFERSTTDFAERYADQNERDYQAFAEAIRSGRLPAVENV